MKRVVNSGPNTTKSSLTLNREHTRTDMRLIFDEFNKNFFHNKLGLILSCTKVSKHELSSSELIDPVLEPDSCDMDTKITV